MAQKYFSTICARRVSRCGVTLRIPFLMILMAALAYSQQMATVTRAGATLHGTPLSTGKVMATLEKGTRIEILIAQGTWHLVQSSEYVGWISNGAIKADEITSSTISDTPAPLQTLTLSPSPPAPANNVPARSSPASRTYFRGPRGGCYYINSNGNKTYVDRSLCN